MDKVKWIKQITGNQPNITNELDALKELKQIRNHLSHFDPPSFCATLEEVERWLNQVIEIGGFLFEIRKAGNVKMSQELMTLMVQPIVKFNPEPVFMNRVPQIPSFSGYQTANWKKPLKINKPTKTKELNKQNKIKDGLIKLLKEIINKLEK